MFGLPVTLPTIAAHPLFIWRKHFERVAATGLDESVKERIIALEPSSRIGYVPRVDAVDHFEVLFFNILDPIHTFTPVMMYMHDGIRLERIYLSCASHESVSSELSLSPPTRRKKSTYSSKNALSLALCSLSYGVCFYPRIRVFLVLNPDLLHHAAPALVQEHLAQHSLSIPAHHPFHQRLEFVYVLVLSGSS